MDSLTVSKVVTGLRFLTLAVVISFSGELTISLQSAVVSHPAGIRHFWNLRQSRASEQGNGCQKENQMMRTYRSLVTIPLLGHCSRFISYCRPAGCFWRIGNAPAYLVL